MMEKIIHCVWLGGPKTKLAEKCRASWERFASDWEVREWNEVPSEAPAYVQRALRERKWAFASDWMRFWVLEREGGVYLDFDVELVRPLSEDLPEGEWVAGEWVCKGAAVGLNPCAIALNRGSSVAARMLHYYRTADFAIDKTVGDLMSEAGVEMSVLPPEVFCPFDHYHRSLRTERTAGVHHYALSWITPRRRLARWLNWHGLGWLTELLLKARRTFGG